MGMAIQDRDLDVTLIHSDQGTHFTSWPFTRRALDSGLVPSMGSVGECYDCDDPRVAIRSMGGSLQLLARVA